MKPAGLRIELRHMVPPITIQEKQAVSLEGDKVRPLEIRYASATRTLHISFDDGALFALSATLLRVESPSAEVQGHGAGRKITVTGKENVGIQAIEPVGHYAVRLIFDDGHDTGLYAWSYLYRLGLGSGN